MGIKQMTFLDYDGFLEKFETKKTTDDCYTPPNIYEVVRDWAVKEYALEGREIVRPFWPGKHYDEIDYPDGCVVIDNPPFSIISKITRWYSACKIDFFLFSPYLTNLCIPACNHVIAPCAVTYENGARVDTCFVTSLGGDCLVRNAPDLMDAIQAAEDENAKKGKVTLPKYEYPDAVITSAKVGWFCKHHTPYAVRRGDCAFIRKLDNQGDAGIFGGGFLLSERAAAERAAAERAAAERAAAERAAAERAAAERAAAERAAAHRWSLSPREIALQSLLGKEVRQ